MRSTQDGEGLFALPAAPTQGRGAGSVRDLCLSLSRRISAHLELGHIPRVDEDSRQVDGERPQVDGALQSDTASPAQEPGSRVRVLTAYSEFDGSKLRLFTPRTGFLTIILKTIILHQIPVNLAQVWTWTCCKSDFSVDGSLVSFSTLSPYLDPNAIQIAIQHVQGVSLWSQDRRYQHNPRTKLERDG